jgi:hypothetical protein
MKNIFVLESGVQTTTPATKKFFEETPKFYLKVKDGHAVFIDIRDPKHTLSTSPLCKFEDHKNGYIRLQTRHTVINIWSDTYKTSESFGAFVKDVKEWREYNYTLTESGKNEIYMAMMYDGVVISSGSNMSSYHSAYLTNVILRTPSLPNKSSVIWKTSKFEEVHNIVRLASMAAQFIHEPEWRIDLDAFNSIDTDANFITLRHIKGALILLIIQNNELYVSYGDIRYVFDETKTVGDNVRDVISLLEL